MGSLVGLSAKYAGVLRWFSIFACAVSIVLAGNLGQTIVMGWFIALALLFIAAVTSSVLSTWWFIELKYSKRSK
ncbi:hypothetical protein [Novosphingobium sp.]|uniref:hypothetical protein n=1 Tax=Novosphingobium sp. TaxID=1874826 RepID=UPI00286E1281|nr:hypothetical protein [Novosphingobium sp.]